MTELENRAHEALHQAFCKLREVIQEPINEKRRNYAFYLADAAHNIPYGLIKKHWFGETLEKDVEHLEKWLAENPDGDEWERLVK